MVHSWYQYLMVPVPTIAQCQTSLTGQRTKEISVLQLNSSKLIKLISEIIVVNDITLLSIPDFGRGRSSTRDDDRCLCS